MFKNFTLASIISIIIIGLFVGVVFVYADWTAPLSSPPTCVAGNPGCDAPINTGSVSQIKNSSLGLTNGLIIGDRAAIGTLIGSSQLTVNGIIESIAGGFKFPDGTTQITAAGGGGDGNSGNSYAAGSNLSLLGNTFSVVESPTFINVTVGDGLISNGTLVANGNTRLGNALTDTTTVSGQVKIIGGSPGAGKVLTSDALGLATWQIGSSYNAGTNLSLSGNTFSVVNNPTFSGSLTVQGGTVLQGATVSQLSVSGFTTLGNTVGDITSIKGRTNFGAGTIRLYKCPLQNPSLSISTTCVGQLGTMSSCATYNALSSIVASYSCTATNIYIE